jgi:hypothetical protein
VFVCVNIFWERRIILFNWFLCTLSRFHSIYELAIYAKGAIRQVY